MHSHNHKPTPHIKEISAKLQHEVDTILVNISEKMLYAEFCEDQVFDIHNGDHNEVSHHTLEERLTSGNRVRRENTLAKIDRTALIAKKKIGKIGRVATYLFKPLAY